MPRVLVTPVQFRDAQAAYFQPLRDVGLEIVFPSDQRYTSDPAALLAELEGIDAVVCSTEPYGPDVLSQAKLRVVARTGVGFDSVNIPAATAADTVVTITPGAVDVSVAEHTLGLILAVYRDIVGRSQEVRAGQWSRAGMPRIDGKTIGIVGLGRIGRAVVPRAQGLGLKVIAHDPYPNEEFADQNDVRYCELNELLATADIISLHIPCTETSAKMINAESLTTMKSDAVLINTGRGGLVDEEALYAAMSSGHLFGAGLDVLQQEPTPTDNPLLTLSNVVVSTHTAGLDHQSEFDMPRIAAECVANLYQGNWPTDCVINKELSGDWTW